MVNFAPDYVSEAIWQVGGRARSPRRRGSTRCSTGHPQAEREAALDEWGRRIPQPVATVAQVADHVEHVAKVAGYDHVGIGGDLDGIDR